MLNAIFSLENIKRKINFTLITALLLSTMLVPQGLVSAADGDLTLETADVTPSTASLDFYVEDTLQITVENYNAETHNVLIEKYTTPDKAATAPMSFSALSVDEDTAQIPLTVDNNGKDDSDFTPGFYIVKVVSIAEDNAVIDSEEFNVISRFTGANIQIFNPDELGVGGELVFTTTYELKDGGSLEAAPQTAPVTEVIVSINDSQGPLEGYASMHNLAPSDLYSITDGTYTVPLNEDSFTAGETYVISINPVDFNYHITDEDYGTTTLEALTESEFDLINILDAELTPESVQDFVAGSTFKATTAFTLQDGEGEKVVTSVPSHLFEFGFYHDGNGLTPVEIPEGVEVIQDLGNGMYNVTLPSDIFTPGNYAFTLEPATDELVKPWDSLEFNVYQPFLTGITENLTADFNPAFVASNLDYTLAANSGEGELLLTVDLAFEDVTLQFASDQDSEITTSITAEGNDVEARIDLAEGNNSITVTASRFDGAKVVNQIYTFVVNRAAGGGGGGNNDDDQEDTDTSGGGGGAPDKVNNDNDNDSDSDVETLDIEEEEETNFISCLDLDDETAFADIEGHWAQSYIEVLADAGAVSGKTPTAFEPNDHLTRAEAAKIILCGLDFEIETGLTGFSDTDGHWADDMIATAKKRGIVHGYPNGEFRPNVGVSRAEVLVMLLNAKGVDTTTSPDAKFSDLDRNAWYIDAVDFAYEHGIISGYGNGAFGPHNKVTRAEVAKMAVLISQL